MPARVDPAALRAAMARFPTGVTVVTALGPGGPAGATANAVASLSLEPPMMLACLDLGSRTLVAVEHARVFGINILAADQAELARRFSTKDPHPEKWDGVAWSEHAGTPLIEGALVWLACELRAVHDGGDHAIATGTVLELDEADGEPLIFHGGEYRPLG
ncbi:MAG TPA: flavin reductase family protein [Solirubrobacterales bacterium]|nr:flavin reductase family protein [Solirubrobacterales bacterium]